jgi:hypothetical protein
MFGGIYYWFDKITGVAYNEILGQIHFWIFFIGVNFTFFPMHFLGVAGMPRRVPDYPDAFYAYNKIASWGSYVSAWSTLVFFYMVYEALSRESNLLKKVITAYLLDVRSILLFKQVPRKYILICLSGTLFFIRQCLEAKIVYILTLPLIVYVLFYLLFMLPVYLTLSYPKGIGLTISKYIQKNTSWVYFEGFGTVFYACIVSSNNPHQKTLNTRKLKGPCYQTKRHMFTSAKGPTAAVGLVIAENVHSLLSLSAKPIVTTLASQTAAVEKLIQNHTELELSSMYYDDWASLVNQNMQSLKNMDKINLELGSISKDLAKYALQNPELNPDVSPATNLPYLTVFDCKIINQCVLGMAERLDVLVNLTPAGGIEPSTEVLRGIKNILSYVRVIENSHLMRFENIITDDVYRQTCQDNMTRIYQEVEKLAKFSDASVSGISEINSKETTITQDAATPPKNVDTSEAFKAEWVGSKMSVTLGKGFVQGANLMVVGSLCAAALSFGLNCLASAIESFSHADQPILKEKLKGAHETFKDTVSLIAPDKPIEEVNLLEQDDLSPIKEDQQHTTSKAEDQDSSHTT